LVQAAVQHDLAQHIFAADQFGFGIQLFLANRVFEHHGSALLRSDHGIETLLLHQQFGLGAIGGVQKQGGQHGARENAQKTQGHHPFMAKADGHKILQRE